jgi:hypothetical protein
MADKTSVVKQSGMARAGGLTAAQIAFAQWLALPPQRRLQRTEIELAATLGVHHNTLQYWKRDPFFRAQASRAAYLMIKNHIPQIMGAALENMVKPEGWQERVAFYRYLAPAIEKEYNDGGFNELMTPIDRAAMDETSVTDLIASLEPEKQAAVMQVLQQITNVQLPDNVYDVQSIQVEKDWEEPIELSENYDNRKTVEVVASRNSQQRPMLGMSSAERMRRRKK